jgi:FixJ family two-component response regulator
MPTIYLIDDDPSARHGLARLLRAAGQPVRLFTSAREFLDAGPPPGPGCLVLDVRMPEVSGLDLQERLAREECPMPIIFITGHGDIPMSVRAMKQGAVDFLPKPVDRAQLMTAIQLALQKDTAARRDREGRREVQRRLEQLTEREREVMQLVIRGWLNKQIAAELGIAEPTVKIHRGRVMDKLGVESVAELILLVQQAGLNINSTAGPDSAAPALV